MTIGSRVLRILLAASTLHLMLAVPARACPTETEAAQTVSQSAQAPADAALHLGHHMPGAPVRNEAPAPKAPADHHMPCCPTPASGCQPGACSAPTAVVLIVADVAIAEHPVAAPPSLTATRWVSYAPEPEPPPPRA